MITIYWDFPKILSGAHIPSYLVPTFIDAQSLTLDYKIFTFLLLLGMNFAYFSCRHVHIYPIWF